MQYLHWQENFSVGVPRIDNQHQGLFRTLNRLIILMEDKPRTSELEDILDDLLDYFEQHCKYEENLLSGHPGIGEHRKKHNEYIHKIKTFETNFLEKDMDVLATSMFIFLSEWLQHHIKTEDVQFFQYLRDQGFDLSPEM